MVARGAPRDRVMETGRGASDVNTDAKHRDHSSTLVVCLIGPQSVPQVVPQIDPRSASERRPRDVQLPQGEAQRIVRGKGGPPVVGPPATSHGRPLRTTDPCIYAAIRRSDRGSRSSAIVTTRLCPHVEMESLDARTHTTSKADRAEGALAEQVPGRPLSPVWKCPNMGAPDAPSSPASRGP